MNQHDRTSGSMQTTRAMATLAVSALASMCVGCGGGGDEADATPRAGWIDLTEIQSSGLYFNRIDANFWRQLQPGDAQCGRSVEHFGNGECTVTRTEAPVCHPACAGGQSCVWQADCAAAECVASDSERAPLEAGEISIAGGSGQPTVTGTWNPTGAYQFDVPSGDWWSDGDTLTVSAPGDLFPAFSVVVTAPPAPAVLTDLGALTAETFTSGNDVPVEWTAGDGSHQVVVAMETDAPMVCVTADDGHFDIPAGAIAALGVSPASWAVSVDYCNKQVVNAGVDGEVTVTVGTSGGSAMIANN